MKIKSGSKYLWKNRLHTVRGFYTNMEGKVCKDLAIISMVNPSNNIEGHPRVVPTKELVQPRSWSLVGVTLK